MCKNVAIILTSYFLFVACDRAEQSPLMTTSGASTHGSAPVGSSSTNSEKAIGTPSALPLPLPMPAPNPSSPPLQSSTQTADVLVYGATSSGVIAAIEVARSGKTVILLEPHELIGGMTASGLGWTDTGIASSIGGLAREFYLKVASYYKSTSPSYAFEPHVASVAFKSLLADAKISVVTNAMLASVAKKSNAIESVQLVDGRNFAAKMFIDATYEGDLLAKSNISFTVGREARSEYNESTAGSTALVATDVPVDPFVTPGDPTSGLIPYIGANSSETIGSGDKHVMAYNYRLCVTSKVGNTILFTKPPTYAAAKFEWLVRYLKGLEAAGKKTTVDSFLKLSPLPNSKFDMNNAAAPFSTDLVGVDDDYAMSDEATRAHLASLHREYMESFFYFLMTDPSVPTDIQDSVKKLGLCKDEFVSTGGWPSQLYVREARRMKGAYVMTEQNVRNTRTISDSIGLGSYSLDSHFLQRMPIEATDSAGHKYWTTATEGWTLAGISKPYPIAYSALTPLESESNNLLVTVCFSATHSAYRSLRMEPVFMMTGHAAGAAAALALDSGVTVQHVNYLDLSKKLLAEKALLQ